GLRDPSANRDRLAIADLAAKLQANVEDRGPDHQFTHAIQSVAALGDDLPTSFFEELEINGVVHMSEGIEMTFANQHGIFKDDGKSGGRFHGDDPRLSNIEITSHLPADVT